MRFISFISLRIIFVLALVLVSGESFARTEQGLDRSKLKGFAQLFVNRIGQTLQRFEVQEVEFSDVEEGNNQQLSVIPDGEVLLLRPKFGKYVFDYDLYAIKQAEGIYFSFEDIVAVLDLAIDYDPETQSGSGWFLREDWDFDIDFAEKQVASRGKNYSIAPKEVYEEDDLIFVRSDVLAKWLSMELTYDLSQQYAFIETPYPLPEVARMARLDQSIGGGIFENVAQLPRKDQDYKWLDINTGSVRLDTRYRSPEAGRSTRRSTMNVSLEGQALKHQAYFQVAKDNEQGISRASGRLFKRHEEPDLLGPLKARSYIIGDTNSPRVPLTSSGGQELGVRVSNNPLVNVDFEVARINGNSIPGWDVELYHEGVLVGSQTTQDNGFYDFNEVALLVGDNRFELFFYGPQGEIRSEEISIPVTADLLATQKNVYDVSLSLSERQVYIKDETEDVDRNRPHFVGRYNTLIGDTLVYAGLNSRSFEGEQKTLLAAGATKVWGQTLLDSNLAIDIKGQAAASLSARRLLGEWSARGSATVKSDGYSSDSKEAGNVKIFGVSGNAHRKFDEIFGVRSNILASTRYDIKADGQSTIAANLGLGAQYRRFSFSNNTLYQKNDNSNDDNSLNINSGSSITSDADDTRLENIFSARFNSREWFGRGGFGYKVKPEASVDRYFSQLSYRPNSRLTSDLFLNYDPKNSYKSTRLNMNYAHDYFRFSPYVEYDSNDELVTGANVNFNVYKDPQKELPQITAKQVAGRGLVSSFVFYDKDGNSVFDGDDEPLENVVVESINVRRRAFTDETGYSLINNLPPTRATDIHVDVETLPDSFMISGFDGVSIFPRAGEVVELQFPIHMSGEIDGTVYSVHRKLIGTQEGSAPEIETSREYVARAEVMLVSLDEKRRVMKASSALDGFYVLSQVPPGLYMLTVSSKTAKQVKSAPQSVQLINIGYGGEILYGQDITLDKQIPYVPIDQVYIEDEAAAEGVYGDLAALQGRKGTPLFMLGIGKGGKSRLKNILDLLLLKRAPDDLFDGLLVQDIEALGAGTHYMFAQNNTPERLYKRCSKMRSHGVECNFEVVTTPKSAPLQTAAVR